MTRDRRFFFDEIAERFEGQDHPHDVRRRLEVVFEECLGVFDLRGKRVLDAGCGYGLFSEAAQARGARVVSADIGPNLVRLAVRRSSSLGVVSDASALAFADGSFDVVISSEMIEHAERPVAVVGELGRVLKPGGLLVLTTPNIVWQWPVRTASRVGLRPFRGLENFVGWRALETWCRAADLEVVLHLGFHAWPFQLGFAVQARRVERRLGRTRIARLMVNQAVVSRKAGA